MPSALRRQVDTNSEFSEALQEASALQFSALRPKPFAQVTETSVDTSSQAPTPIGVSPPSPVGEAETVGPLIRPTPTKSILPGASVPAIPFVSQKPLLIEICGGSCLLSSVAQEQGFGILPVDFVGNKFRPYVRVVHLDLRLPSSWEFLSKVLEQRPVAHIHLAPPCGTCSRRLSGSRSRTWDGGGLARLACCFIDLNAMARLTYLLIVVLLVLGAVPTVMATRRKPKRRPVEPDDGGDRGTAAPGTAGSSFPMTVANPDATSQNARYRQRGAPPPLDQGRSL